MKFTSKAAKDCMIFKIFTAKKLFHYLLNFNSQSRGRLPKVRPMSSKQHMIRGNLFYRNLSMNTRLGRKGFDKKWHRRELMLS